MAQKVCPRQSATSRAIFISYCDTVEDLNFVTDTLVPYLRQQASEYQCFYAAKDMLPNDTYVRFVSKMVERVQIVVLVLSNGYMSDKICRMDYQEIFHHFIENTPPCTLVAIATEKLTEEIPEKLTANDLVVDTQCQYWKEKLMHKIRGNNNGFKVPVSILNSKFVLPENSEDVMIFSKDELKFNRRIFKVKKVPNTAITLLHNCQVSFSGKADDIIGQVFCLQISEHGDSVTKLLAEDTSINKLLPYVKFGPHIHITCLTPNVETLGVEIHIKCSTLQGLNRCRLLYSKSESPVGKVWEDVTDSCWLKMDPNRSALFQFTAQAAGCYIICSVLRGIPMDMEAVYTTVSAAISQHINNNFIHLVTHQILKHESVPNSQVKVVVGFKVLSMLDKDFIDILSKSEGVVDLYIRCSAEALFATVSMYRQSKILFKEPFQLRVSKSADTFSSQNSHQVVLWHRNDWRGKVEYFKKETSESKMAVVNFGIIKKAVVGGPEHISGFSAEAISDNLSGDAHEDDLLEIINHLKLDDEPENDDPEEDIERMRKYLNESGKWQDDKSIDSENIVVDTPKYTSTSHSAIQHIIEEFFQEHNKTESRTRKIHPPKYHKRGYDYE